MRDIEAFDAKRRVFHIERFAEILERFGTGGEVACPAQFPEPHGFFRICAYRLKERFLFAPLRHPYIDALTAEERANLIGAGWHVCHENLVRCARIGTLVELCECPFHEFSRA